MTEMLKNVFLYHNTQIANKMNNADSNHTRATCTAITLEFSLKSAKLRKRTFNSSDTHLLPIT